MIYLQRHPKSYIHAVFAGTDALLYPALDKLITSLDLTSPTPTFTYVTKRNILTDLSLNEEQFLDAGILAGFDHAQPFPPHVADNSLKPLVDLVRQYKSGVTVVGAFQDHLGVKQTNYMEIFARTRCMIKFSLILTADGSVQPLPLSLNATTPQGGHHTTIADIPKDLEDIFTARLPDEVYYYLSRGLIGPQALIWLTSGQIVENPPLDNGETTEYRRFVKEILTEVNSAPRAIALALVSRVLHESWKDKKVAPWFWFDPNGMSGKPVGHSNAQTTQLVDRVSGWTVSNGVIEEELRRQSVSIFFQLCYLQADLPGSSRQLLISHFVSVLQQATSWRHGPAPNPRQPRNPILRKRTKWSQTSSGVSSSCEGEHDCTCFTSISLTGAISASWCTPIFIRLLGAR